MELSIKNESVKVSNLHLGHSKTRLCMLTHKPNIILGTESHLENTIASNEVFPDQFKNPYRKDRKLGEGGVFLAVDCTYITSEIAPNR
jgi:hypothetical protein